MDMENFSRPRIFAKHEFAVLVASASGLGHEGRGFDPMAGAPTSCSSQGDLANCWTRGVGWGGG